MYFDSVLKFPPVLVNTGGLLYANKMVHKGEITYKYNYKTDQNCEGIYSFVNLCIVI